MSNRFELLGDTEGAPVNNLMVLREIVAKDVVAMGVADSADSKLLGILRTFTRKPLMNFGGAYDYLMRHLVVDPDLYDRWIRLQLRVQVRLGPKSLALEELFDQVVETFGETPGGNGSDLEIPVGQGGSFRVALAYHLFIDEIHHEPDN